MTEFEEIASRAMTLSPQKKAQLAEILIQSLDEKEDDTIKSAWIKKFVNGIMKSELLPL